MQSYPSTTLQSPPEFRSRRGNGVHRNLQRSKPKSRRTNQLIMSLILGRDGGNYGYMDRKSPPEVPVS
jgi:hypothetical protein